MNRTALFCGVRAALEEKVTREAAQGIYAAHLVHPTDRVRAPRCTRRDPLARALVWGAVSLLAPLVALFLAGCGPTRPDAPVAECPMATDVQVVERNVYVRLPIDLGPVVDPDPGKTGTSTTYGQAVKRADTRDTLLQSCNAKLREASELQGRLVEEP